MKYDPKRGPHVGCTSMFVIYIVALILFTIASILLKKFGM